MVYHAPAPSRGPSERTPRGELRARLDGAQPLVGRVHGESEPAPQGMLEPARAPGHRLRAAVQVERLPDHQTIRLPVRDDSVDAGPVRLTLAHADGDKRTRGSGDRLPHRYPDAALAVVEGKEGFVGAHACPARPDRLCISIPRLRAASSHRSSNGASNTMWRSAGPLNHAF